MYVDPKKRKIIISFSCLIIIFLPTHAHLNRPRDRSIFILFFILFVLFVPHIKIIILGRHSHSLLKQPIPQAKRERVVHAAAATATAIVIAATELSVVAAAVGVDGTAASAASRAWASCSDIRRAYTKNPLSTSDWSIANNTMASSGSRLGSTPNSKLLDVPGRISSPSRCRWWWWWWDKNIPLFVPSCYLPIVGRLT